jgi:hypothetical protein
VGIQIVASQKHRISKLPEVRHGTADHMIIVGHLRVAMRRTLSNGRKQAAAAAAGNRTPAYWNLGDARTCSIMRTLSGIT